MDVSEEHVLSHRPTTREQTHNPGMRPDRELNPQTSALQDDAQPTEPHYSGPGTILNFPSSFAAALLSHPGDRDKDSRTQRHGTGPGQCSRKPSRLEAACLSQAPSSPHLGVCGRSHYLYQEGNVLSQH